MNNSTDTMPLLRKDKASPQLMSHNVLEDNNDEAERLIRRNELNASNNSSHSIRTDRRQSLGLSLLSHVPDLKMKEHVSECIKLSVENKINVKNAFSLNIIDFMSYMVKKQDEDISNLQLASSGLDASAKVYGFRVDGMYMETVKMMGGLEKQEKEDAGTRENVDSTNENVDNQPDKKEKRKKKRSSQHILSSVDALRGKVEVFDPVAIMENEDIQSSDKLVQALLPNHAGTGFHLNLYNDIVIDVATQTTAENTNISITIPNIEDFSSRELCPWSDFEFLNFTYEPQTEKHNETQVEETEGNFHFDPNASLVHDNEPVYIDCNDFDDDGADYVESCNREPTRTQNIVDLREIIKSTELADASEYSFIPKNFNLHWAGPSHWKLRNLKQTLNTTNTVEVCTQGATKKKKEIELKYSDNEHYESLEVKFLPKKTTRRPNVSNRKNWAEEDITLPPDSHYDIVDAMNRLHLHFLIKYDKGKTDNLNATYLSNISNELENYNYNNENDMSNYQPEILDDDCEVNEGDNFVEADPHMAFTGDNLVPAPKLTNNIRIPYSLRAKKIDMRQLKGCIWKCLTSSNKENPDVQETTEKEDAEKVNEVKLFSEIYKALPNMLTESNAEALSFPTAFVSLLHLANERSLCVESLPDMSDIIVKKD